MYWYRMRIELYYKIRKLPFVICLLAFPLTLKWLFVSVRLAAQGMTCRGTQSRLTIRMNVELRKIRREVSTVLSFCWWGWCRRWETAGWGVSVPPSVFARTKPQHLCSYRSVMLCALPPVSPCQPGAVVDRNHYKSVTNSASARPMCYLDYSTQLHLQRDYTN
jgi:hypothetical protein